AQKASPVPVTITTSTLLSCASSSHASHSARCTSLLMAFLASGRFRQRAAMRSLTSRSTTAIFLSHITSFWFYNYVIVDCKQHGMPRGLEDARRDQDQPQRRGQHAQARADPRGGQARVPGAGIVGGVRAGDRPSGGPHHRGPCIPPPEARGKLH